MEPEQVFLTCHGDKVKLDRRVPGDGTQWYVATWWNGSWAYLDDVIEPGELKEYLPDEEAEPGSPVAGL